MSTEHQQIANELELFFFNEMSPGSCFFLPDGTKIYNNLMNYLRKYYKLNGYKEVITPNIFDKELWMKSGHWEKYQENMYHLSSNTKEEENRYSLKPMNCPSHCIMFNHMNISYNQLPLRLADFGVLHRNELSGALRGLTRVRRFQQDDAHIFCKMDQIESEIEKMIKFIEEFYVKIGFKYKIGLSTRPEKFIGNEEKWNLAEKILEEVLKKLNINFELNPGEGAFYGPKLDITIKDNKGREHQCGTIQLDFNLPERFDLKYLDKDGKHKQPIMIHRAFLGSIERFIAILLEHTGGRLPFNLSPRQILILTIGVEEEILNYSKEIMEKLIDYDIELNDGYEDIRTKIKNAEKLKYNYILVIGKKENENKTIAVRSNENKQKIMKIEELMEELRCT